MATDGLNEVEEIVRRVGTFSAQLIPKKDRWNYKQSDTLQCHKDVLQPLLNIATECWAYGLDTSSEAYHSAANILERKKGKYLVNTQGDPVSGHEALWNAQGGIRGSIVILVPANQFIFESIFPKCHGIFVAENFLAGHTPAAVKFARERVASDDVIAFCLPRNNGIEWTDIYINPSKALDLLKNALRLCPGE